MNIGRTLLSASLVSVLAMGLFAGCGKSSPPNNASSQPPPPKPPTVTYDQLLRVHWLGKKRIAADTNASNFLAIWNLSEGTRLQTQTLDRLATAPWRFLPGQSASNAPVALLRPLLDDVVQEESWIEIQQATNTSAELVFAIRLDDARAMVWNSNLMTVAHSFAGEAVSPAVTGSGWMIRSQPGKGLIEFKRAGDWVVVGSAVETNRLFATCLDRIGTSGTPLSQEDEGQWLDAKVATREMAKLLGLGDRLHGNTPAIDLSLSGDRGNVRTVGQLRFPEALHIDLDTWNIPTNLIDSSFSGFTVVRGIRGWLDVVAPSNTLFAGESPNQAVAWAYTGAPAQVWVAAPMKDAGNQIQHVTERLMERCNPTLARMDCGTIIWSPESHEGHWQGMPFMPAFLEAVKTDGGEFAFCGTLQGIPVWSPPPREMLDAITSRTNLVCYDWEKTGQRALSWLYVTQLLRMSSGHSQFPSEASGVRWMQSAASLLGNAETTCTLADAKTLGFSRLSGFGLSSLELNLLLDWLESPQFPSGLFTFRAKPAQSPVAGTNAPAAN
jgi:hypothetical protein